MKKRIILKSTIRKILTKNVFETPQDNDCNIIFLYMLFYTY